MTISIKTQVQERIRSLGKTQTQLAAEIGTTPASLSRTLGSDVVRPDSQWPAILDALGLELTLTPKVGVKIALLMKLVESPLNYVSIKRIVKLPWLPREGEHIYLSTSRGGETLKVKSVCYSPEYEEVEVMLEDFAVENIGKSRVAFERLGWERMA